MEVTAVITGANSGIGYAIAERLISQLACKRPIRICFACRNMDKAECARQQLLKKYQYATIDLLKVDISKPASVIEAAQEMKKRYNHISWLFCNAGIMPVTGIDPKALLTLNPSTWKLMINTGAYLLKHDDWTTPDGLQAVFATNTFGHYLLIRELEDHLSSQDGSCHILWTSSNAAEIAKVNIEDIQDKRKVAPYSNSKRLVDVISCGLNKRLNNQGIYSDTTCPGLFVSQITKNLLPLWIWYLLLPIIFLIRLIFTNFITFKAENGALSLFWLACQDPSTVDHTVKYNSRTTAFNSTYILREKIGYNDQTGDLVMEQLNQMRLEFSKH